MINRRFYLFITLLLVLALFNQASPATQVSTKEAKDTKSTAKQKEYAKLEEEPKINILGSAYGKVDTTTLVRELVRRNGLQFTVSNHLFVDNWPGITKYLVIVYQYGDYKPVTSIYKDGDLVNIYPNEVNQKEWEEETKNLTILGAAFGQTDVTTELKRRVQGDGVLVTASRSELPTNSPNNPYGNNGLTLVVVYEEKEFINVAITVENAQFRVNKPLLNVLDVMYGRKNFTDQVRAMVQNGASLNFQVSSQNFGDPWPEKKKFMTVVYEDPKGVQAILVQENQWVNIQAIPPHQAQQTYWSFRTYGHQPQRRYFSSYDDL